MKTNFTEGERTITNLEKKVAKTQMMKTYIQNSKKEKVQLLFNFIDKSIIYVSLFRDAWEKGFSFILEAVCLSDRTLSNTTILWMKYK